MTPDPPWIRLKPLAQCGTRSWNRPDVALERPVETGFTPPGSGGSASLD